MTVTVTPKVRFCDGVSVVVDAKAKWMRVTRPVSPGGGQQQQQRRRRRLQEQEQQQQPRQPDPSTAWGNPPGATGGTVAAMTRTRTYDLGRRADGERAGTQVGGGGGGGGRREARERMPRDVKDRMKALPRFISILKGGPSGRKNGAAGGGRVGAVGRGEEGRGAAYSGGAGAGRL